MKYKILISTSELAEKINNPDWIVADCRFMLARPEEKEQLYLKAHLPGAIYVHLDRDLSAPIIPGVTGRHPLPSMGEAARRFGQMGIASNMQVVAYDDQGGSLAAVRLWWMLRWLGHINVAILDGGWQKWLDEDRPVQAGKVTLQPTILQPGPSSTRFFNLDEVDRLRQDPSFRLIDVRAPERYRGEIEPIDPVAGHIPGAINIPYTENLNPDGTFRSPEQLRFHYKQVLGDVPTERVAFYCGSGVTSIHSLLAMLHAGLGEPGFYPGSWSEWIADRSRPVAIGPGQF